MSWAQSTGAEVRYDPDRRDRRAGLLAALALVALAAARQAELDERRLDAFWAGAAIYVGTYVFSSNFDYRLVFLLLCVPQLCAWRRDGVAPAPWPGGRRSSRCVGTLWLSSTSPPLLPFGLQSWYLGLDLPAGGGAELALFAWLVAALGSGLLGLRRRRLAT